MEERSSLTGRCLAVPQVQKAAGCPEGSPAPCPSLPTQLFPPPDPDCDAFWRKWRVIHKLNHPQAKTNWRFWSLKTFSSIFLLYRLRAGSSSGLVSL